MTIDCKTTIVNHASRAQASGIVPAGYRRTTDVDKQVTVRRLGGHLGATIGGIALSGDLAREIVNWIRHALHRHKVIFFRAQHHLDGPNQEAFAALLGPLERYSNAPVMNGTGHLWSMNSDDGLRADSWHTDVTYQQAFPSASILRAVRLPPFGGDTLWASTVAGYQALPPPLKLLAENLRATHANFGPAPTVTTANYKDPQGFVPTLFQSEHPVVEVHPVTAERSLLLGHHWRSFVGLPTAESLALYEIFQRYVTRPEHVVRWTWEEGDVAIWDNRATQHYGSADYDETRLMHRVTLAGGPVVGVHGDSSEAQNDRVPDRPERTS
jgi:taurine dioxygenase